MSKEIFKNKYNMNKDTLIRWLCLMEIIQKTEQKAKELSLNLDKIDWIKPVAFKKYMSERFKSMEIDLEAEERELNNSRHIPKYCSQTYQKQNVLIRNQRLEDTKKPFEQV
jgi:disulfide oxidoreductase YuzD